MNTSLKNSTYVEERNEGIIIMYVKLIGCIMVMLLTSFGNLLVCFSVLIYKKCQTKTNLILFSLAFSDLLMVISMAFNTVMIQRGKWPYGRTLCTIVSSLSLSLCFISILHLYLLGVDRYIAIKNPFKHQHLMTVPRIIILLIFIWTVPSIAINLPYADFDFRSSVFGCLIKSASVKHSNPASSFILVLLFVVIPFAILFYVYVYLFKVVRKHARRIAATQLQLTLPTTAPHEDGAQRITAAQLQSTLPITAAQLQSTLPTTAPHKDGAQRITAAQLQSTLPTTAAQLQSTLPTTAPHEDGAQRITAAQLQSTLPTTAPHEDGAQRITAAQLQSTLPITAAQLQSTLPTTAPHQDGGTRTKAIMKKEVKLIKTFALVIGAFLLCYTPFFLLGTYQSYKGPGTVSDHVLSAVSVSVG